MINFMIISVPKYDDADVITNLCTLPDFELCAFKISLLHND